MNPAITDALLVLSGIAFGYGLAYEIVKRPTIEEMTKRVVDAKVKAQLKAMAEQEIIRDVTTKLIAANTGSIAKEIQAHSTQGYPGYTVQVPQTHLSALGSPPINKTP